MKTQHSAQAEEAGETPEHVSKHYAQGAAEIITPILCQRLCQQEEDADEDEWNVSKSASVCIGMLAQTIGDIAVNLFIPFITQVRDHAYESVKE